MGKDNRERRMRYNSLNNEILCYYFPMLGKVKIEMKNNTKIFYDFLVKRGEINRLKELKHIGILYSLFPGIEHTRYDYTLLTLFLSQKLRLSEYTDKTIENMKISKKEFLELLILASNIGHVYGTFAIEKGILRFLLESRKLNEFLDILDIHQNKKKKIKKWLQDIQDYTLFHKVLALIKLSEWLKDSEGEIKNVLRKVIEIILTLISEEEENLKDYQQELYEQYTILKRISYLFLDTLYLQLPLKIDFLEIFENLGSEMPNENKEIEKLIFQYEKIVYDRLYHNPDARLLTAIVSKKTFKILKNENNPIETITLWSKKEVIPEIEEILDPSIKSMRNYTNICSIALGEWSGDFLLEEILGRGVIKTEDEIYKTINNRHLIPHILYLKRLDWESFGKVWLDLFTSSGDKDRVRYIVKLFSYLAQFDIPFGEDKIFEVLFKCLLKHALPQNNIEIELKIHPKEFFGEELEARIFLVKNLKTSKDDVKEIIQSRFSIKENPQWDKQKKERFHEHMALWELIKKLRRKLYRKKKRLKNRLFLILPCSITIIDKEIGEPLAEFDGGVLEMKTGSGRALFYILEAKRGRTGNAQEEIRSKFSRLQTGVPP